MDYVFVVRKVSEIPTDSPNNSAEFFGGGKLLKIRVLYVMLCEVEIDDGGLGIAGLRRDGIGFNHSPSYN